MCVKHVQKFSDHAHFIKTTPIFLLSMAAAAAYMHAAPQTVRRVVLQLDSNLTTAINNLLAM